MKAHVILVLVVSLVLSSAYAQVFIDEIMYDPLGADSGHEWLEVYNEENYSINFSQWKLRENAVNHTLNFISGNSVLEPNEYALIADDSTVFRADYPGFNSTLFDTSFSSGLSGNGENLSLVNGNGSIVFSVFYNTSLGADGNGRTLCYINESWKECTATPGTTNRLFIANYTNNASINNTPTANYTKNVILHAYLSEEVYTNSRYTSLFRIQIENKNCSNTDNVTVKYNITGPNYLKSDFFTKTLGCSGYSFTGDFSATTAGNYTLCGEIVNSTVLESNFSDNYACRNFRVIDVSSLPCDLQASISGADSLLYQQDNLIKFTPILNNETFPFMIEYWIEDLFGTIVKNKVNTTNTNQKSWKADISEQDRVLFIKARIYPSCNDTNASNNLAEKMLIVTNDAVIQSHNPINGGSNSLDNYSSINITWITPSETAFGELIKVEVEIYKGNTNKYSVSAWVEKNDKIISEKTKVNLETKFREYELSLPVLLKPNCDDKISDGTAKVIVEGLDQRDAEEISISGINNQLCSGSTSNVRENAADLVNSAGKKEDKQLSYSITSLPATISSSGPLVFKVSFNGDEYSHKFKVWSYLYRGSKCYSCANETKAREENLVELNLNANELKELGFALKLDPDLKEGDYSLKVKINKDPQKTNDELTQSIHLSNEKELSNFQSALLETLSESLPEENPGVVSQRRTLNISHFVVYESGNEKAKKLIPYVLVIVFGLISVVLLGKK